MKSMKSKKTKKNLFCKIISILLVISSISFFGFLFYIDLLPIKYSVILLFVILLFDILSITMVNLKSLKKKIKRVISVFMIFAILVMTIASFYVGKTVGVLLNNGDNKYKLEQYSVLVLKDSSYNELEDIKGEKLGYFENSTGAENANTELSKEVDIDFKSYKTSDSLVHDLLDSKINVIVLENSIKNIMEEELTDFAAFTKVIHTFTIKTEVETTLKEVDVTKESFAVYISGIDTYGEISSVSRSDVNMVMVVNPTIRQILLISIPRDYYVQLHGTIGAKDKLTHAGIYGIDMSIKTIEDLLELDINYYLKVNFTSVIDIVDTLGGLDVYSEYSFISYSGYRFKKGLNSVNGEQALDFARTRKAFTDGDRQRGKNQQAVIEAVIRKATDKSIITKYNSLLNAIDGKYQTNMSIKKTTSLIKMQLEDMSTWTVTSYSLTGTDATDYTYTYNQLLYVMKPDEDSINEAIELINNVLNDEQLETSYNNLSGSSNKVTQVQTNINEESESQNNNIEEDKEETDQEVLDPDRSNTEEDKDNFGQETGEGGSNSLETPENPVDQPENEEPSNDKETDDSISTPDFDSDQNSNLGSEDPSLDPIDPIVPNLES